MDTTCKQCANEECGLEFEVSVGNAYRKKYCCKDCQFNAWVRNNRDKLNEGVRRYRARRYLAEGQWRDNSPKSAASKKWMNEIKSNPCHDCGGNFEICCMDFDHREGTVKAYNVGSMFAHHYGRDLIELELAKCDLVCSNCHRIRTRNRRTGSGKYNRIPGVSENPTTQEGVYGN